jgi:hypothetical protein
LATISELRQAIEEMDLQTQEGNDISFMNGDTLCNLNE